MTRRRTAAPLPGRPGSHRRRWITLLVALLLCMGTVALRRFREPAVQGMPMIALPPKIELLESDVRQLVTAQFARIKADPSQAATYAELGLIYEANKLWPEAREAFRAAMSLEPNTTTWQYHHAVATSEAGDLVAAYPFFAELIKVAPTFAAAQHRWGQACLERGDYDSAGEAFRQVAEHAPQAAEGYVGLADVHLRQGRIEQAIACLEQALAHDKNYKVAHFLLGTALQRQGRTEEAQQALQRGQQARFRFLPDELTQRSEHYAVTILARYQRALDLMSEGQVGSAVTTLEDLLRADPNHVSALNLLAGAYMQANRAADALRILHKARQVDDRKYTTYINLASWHLNGGQLHEALSYAQGAIERANWVMSSQYLRLEILLRLRRHEEFRAALLEARRISPQDPQLSQYEAQWKRQANK